MKELIADYLSNASKTKFSRVEITGLWGEGTKRNVEFSHFYGGTTVHLKREIDVWDVLIFVNGKIK